jgi:outer membrane biosynthesis protein TonB
MKGAIRPPGPPSDPAKFRFAQALTFPSDRGSATLPPPNDSARERPWISLGLSAALHAALLVLAAWLSRAPAEPTADDRRDEAADPSRQVQMVYLQPPARTPPAPRPPPPRPEPPPPPPKPVPPPPPPPPPPAPIPRIAPPPAKEQRTPEPNANAPPEAQRREGEEPTEDKPSGGERAATTDDKPGSTAPAENEAVTMESEAKRIFGRPHPGPRPGAGPQASRPMEAYLPDHPERCIPKPAAPADSAAAQLGVVVGKIFRQDNGRPLAGAHLQMLGTPFVTFTDDQGEYHFRFDLSLVDNCRTQYVRVTAPGYESRLLVLVVGANVQSEDVLLKKR